MSNIGHNRPNVVLDIPRETAEFIVENCESNLHLGISMLQNPDISRSMAEKLVKMIEQFRDLKRRTEGALNG